MDIAIRYYSKSGRTKSIADMFGQELGVKALSITEDNPYELTADLLFIGGAPYANIMAPELDAYVRRIDSAQVKQVVLFTTSNWSMRTVKAMRKILEEKGIPVTEEYFSANAFKMKDGIRRADGFARDMAEKYAI